MDHLNKLLLSAVARRACEIAPIAGKGRGLVALRNLTAGETVLADPPRSSRSSRWRKRFQRSRSPLPIEPDLEAGAALCTSDCGRSETEGCFVVELGAAACSCSSSRRQCSRANQDDRFGDARAPGGACSQRECVVSTRRHLASECGRTRTT